MPSLIKSTTLAYLYIGVLLYIVLLLQIPDSRNYYTLVNIVQFVMYAMLLLWNIGRPEQYYTYGRLACLVFLFAIVGGIMYLNVSYYYAENVYFWDYNDPWAYYLIDMQVINKDIPFYEILAYIETVAPPNWDYGDWGAPLSQSLILKIIPSKYFLYFSQTVLDTLGALMLFDLCCKIMHRQYAYLAALAFSTASFTLFYCVSFRKEIVMMFAIITSFWLFYRYVDKKRERFLILAFLVSLYVLLFRPAVAALIWVSIFSYFLLDYWNRGKVFPIFFALLIAVGLSFSLIYESVYYYTDGGDLSKNENYTDATPFSILTSTIGVLIGPFPQLVQNGVGNFSQLPMYGNGLLFKYLLFMVFWSGFVLCLRNRVAKVLPLYVFCVLEMAGLAVVNDGLELRKALPHIPTFYCAAFWFVSKYDNQKEDKGSEIVGYSVPYLKPTTVFYFLVIIVFASTLLWDTMR